MSDRRPPRERVSTTRTACAPLVSLLSENSEGLVLFRLQSDCPIELLLFSIVKGAGRRRGGNASLAA